MSDSRTEVLNRIRSALKDVSTIEKPEDVPVARDYITEPTTSRHEIIERFIERVAEYKAIVKRVNEPELKAAIEASCRARNAKRIVVPTDMPQHWLPEGVESLPDTGLSYDELDKLDGVLTGCALGISQTGTIILDGGVAQGRRVISLLPDYHLCVVFARQVVGLVPEAFRQLNATASRPMTLISGPSATSDIELNRVEGVHGPRTLEVLVVE